MGWGVGGLLDSEFDMWAWFGLVIGFVLVGYGGGGWRGYGEAACFGDAGDEGVEPLAGEELGVGVRFVLLSDLMDCWIRMGWWRWEWTYFDRVVWILRREA